MCSGYAATAPAKHITVRSRDGSFTRAAAPQAVAAARGEFIWEIQELRVYYSCVHRRVWPPDVALCCRPTVHAGLLISCYQSITPIAPDDMAIDQSPCN